MDGLPAADSPEAGGHATGEACNRLDLRCRHRYSGGFTLTAELSTSSRITALLGPSGSGKTTLLMIIAGLLRPDEGLVRLGPRRLTDTARGVHLAPEQRRIALVPQELSLFPHLSVRGNLVYGLRRRPGPAFTLDAVVEILELGDLLDRPPATLSGGQKQRVALGRAVLAGPQLLLLDEPVTGLDPALRDRVLDHISRALITCGIPAILVSHDREVVRRIAEEVVTVEAGHIGPARGPSASQIP